MFTNFKIQVADEEQLKFVKHFGKKVFEEDENARLTAYVYQGNIYITDFKLKREQCTTTNTN